MQKNSAAHRLRLVSGPEGLSFILLLVGVVLKSTTTFNPVPVLGWIHGMLFIAYVAFLYLAWQKQRWDIKKVAILFILSVVPTGGFFAERMLAKEERGELAPEAA
jgi:integral membrane protein